jgi:hypothetical protein
VLRRYLKLNAQEAEQAEYSFDFIRNVMANERGDDILENKQATTPQAAQTGVQRRKLTPDDECPMCYEKMTEDEQLIWCSVTCGHNMHEICFRRWQKVQKVHQKPHCPMCRSVWPSQQ